jgi:hypothetical protein
MIFFFVSGKASCVQQAPAVNMEGRRKLLTFVKEWPWKDPFKNGSTLIGLVERPQPEEGDRMIGQWSNRVAISGKPGAQVGHG